MENNKSALAEGDGGERIISVLVADDDDDFRVMVSAFLNERGFKVFQAIDGKEAVVTAIENIPDVVLLDMMMPEKSGIDVCKELKNDARTSAALIIMLTVKNQLSDKLTAYMAGAQRYILKGVDLHEVETIIRTVLHQRELNGIQMQDSNSTS